MKAEPFQIKEIHVYLATDKDGVEGVTGFMSGDGIFWPMVCADRARLDSWRDKAQQIAR